MPDLCKYMFFLEITSLSFWGYPGFSEDFGHLLNDISLTYPKQCPLSLPSPILNILKNRILYLFHLKQLQVYWKYLN